MALEEPARRLVLIRHAKSDYPPGVPDHDRPLNDRGRRDAPEVGRWLGGHLGWSGGAAPLVLVSSAVRAQQSWTLAQQHLPAAWSAATTRTEPLIYEASVRTLLAIVSSVPTDVLTVVMVGHNPGLADLIDRNPWGIVRTMPGVKPGEGLYVASIPDVTANHWRDIGALNELKQRVSAASDAQQGMPTADGIRSATEIQRLTQLGSQRLGVLSRIISATTMRPMVHMMVSNLQDAIAMNGSIRSPEGTTPGLLAPMVNNGYIDFDINDIQGDIEYLVVDGTLPVEPTRSPETWMQILQVVQSTGLNMEYNAGRIAEEAIKSMGIPDVEQFKISPEQAQQGPTMSQQLSLMEKMRGANVMPQDQVLREAERGNIVPLRG